MCAVAGRRVIGRASWRRIDSPAIESSTGTSGGAGKLLLTTDYTSVSVLHLTPGGHTALMTDAFGQLVVIVDGAGVVEVGQEQTAVRLGDAVRWPPNVPHRLRTDDGISVVVVAHPEGLRSWRVIKVDAQGRRWVVGVFGDTERARAERDRLRARAGEGEQVVLE